VDDDKISAVVPDRLSNILGCAIDYLEPRRDKETGEIVLTPIDVPVPIVREALAVKGAGFRPLKRIITAPIIREDGSLLCTPGYDRQTGLLLLGKDFPPTPANPTERESRQALETVCRPFQFFPFCTVFDKSVLITALLTAVTRHLYETAPAVGFDGPTMGSGKTILGFCVQVIGGVRPGVEAFPEKDEMNNSLVSSLSSGKLVLFYDNVDGEIENSTLETFLSSPRYEGRLFYKQQNGDLENNILVMLSGINMRLSKALVRRALICRIDPRVEEPYRRSFLFDPVEYCKQHRQALVAALLTIQRGFIAAGRPRDPASGGKLGSFAGWDDNVRQCILWLKNTGIAELGDPIRCIQASKEADLGYRELGSFLHLVRETQKGSKAWTAKDLIASTKVGSDLHDVLTDVAGDKFSPNGVSPRRLGNWLANNCGRRIDGLCVSQREKSENSKKSVSWFVCSEGDDPNPGQHDSHDARLH